MIRNKRANGRAIGIIGGIGPLATAFFYRRLVELTPAYRDEEHIPIILISDPALPSRIDHLLGQGPSPRDMLCDIAVRLERAGADIIVIPSVTTHSYYDNIAAAVGVPVLHLLREVGNYLQRTALRRPAILATSATAKTRLLDRYLIDGTHPIYPDERVQTRLMQVIRRVKAGEGRARLRTELEELMAGDWASSADSVVLGCTELPIIAPRESPRPLVSVTDVLATATLRVAALPAQADAAAPEKVQR